MPEQQEPMGPELATARGTCWTCDWTFACKAWDKPELCPGCGTLFTLSFKMLSREEKALAVIQGGMKRGPYQKRRQPCPQEG